MELLTLWGSKRTELVTLNTSQRNWRLCLSVQGMTQRLERPRSTPKKPSPRMKLRKPASPGNGSRRNAAEAVPPTLKILTDPSAGFLKEPVWISFGGMTGTALPPRSQLVGKLKPLKMLIGKPLVHRKSPDSCQPPTRASSPLPIFRPMARFRPKGRSAIQLELNWCVVSKSEGARNWKGDQEFTTSLPPIPPKVPTRSASEERSIDLE